MCTWLVWFGSIRTFDPKMCHSFVYSFFLEQMRYWKMKCKVKFLFNNEIFFHVAFWCSQFSLCSNMWQHRMMLCVAMMAIKHISNHLQALWYSFYFVPISKSKGVLEPWPTMLKCGMKMMGWSLALIIVVASVFILNEGDAYNYTNWQHCKQYICYKIDPLFINVYSYLLLSRF